MILHARKHTTFLSFENLFWKVLWEFVGLAKLFSTANSWGTCYRWVEISQYSSDPSPQDVFICHVVHHQFQSAALRAEVKSNTEMRHNYRCRRLQVQWKWHLQSRVSSLSKSWHVMHENTGAKSCGEGGEEAGANLQFLCIQLLERLRRNSLADNDCCSYVCSKKLHFWHKYIMTLASCRVYF